MTNAAQAQAEARKDEIRLLLAGLGELVNDYGNGRKIHWGHEGSLSHVRELVSQAYAFLADMPDTPVNAVLEKLRQA